MKYKDFSEMQVWENAFELLVSERLGYIKIQIKDEIVEEYYEVIKELDSLIFKLES